MAGAGVHVLRWIDNAILNLILKLRITHSEGKGEVHTLFRYHFFLGDILNKLNLLLVFKEADFAGDHWSVFCGAFQRRPPTVNCGFYRNEMPLRGSMNLQVRLW
jgi:hypothetical protein